MTNSRPLEANDEIRKRVLAQLEEALKLLDQLDMGVAAARLDHVIDEVRASLRT